MTRDYTCSIAAGTLLVAQQLALLEPNPARRQKKELVVERKLRLLRDAFPGKLPTGQSRWEARALLDGNWTQEEAKALVIDLAFSNPFAPYDLSFRDADFGKSLVGVAEVVGLNERVVQRIRDTQRDALRAHRHIDWKKIAAYGLGGLIVASTGGWLAAPVIGAALGSAAGLSGAAATAHGLALLGGGSLAVGGAGMAGGIWVVTGVGAAAGLLSGAGSTALIQLGATALRMELVKLQVSYKENILLTQLDIKKSQGVIGSLVRQRDEMRAMLEEEQMLNDTNSARLKDIEAKVTAFEDAIEWMEKTA